MMMRIFILFLLMHITRWLYIGKVGILYKTGIKHQLLIHSYYNNTILTQRIYHLTTKIILPIAQSNISTLYK
jgi:hypothetical protein